MANIESRIQKIRSFQGEEDAAPLVNWLNETKNEAGKQRILKIFNCFGEAVLNYPERKDQAKLLSDYNGLINETLNYYNLIPQMLVLSRSGKLSLSVSWVAAPGSKLEREARAIRSREKSKKSIDHYNLPGASMNEIEALLHMLELLKTRTHWRISACGPGQRSPCGKFFFMKFPHQRFCSDKCRVAAFRGSSEARAKRNEYARNLYHLHKTGNVK